MQNLSCRNVLNVKFPKIVAEKFAFYTLELTQVLPHTPLAPETSASTISSPAQIGVQIYK